MRRFFPLFACFSLTAFGVHTARGEFDASGSQAGPVQIQANRPRQNQDLEFAELLRLLNGAPGGAVIIDVSDDTILMRLVAAPPGRPVKPKPGPAKKPVRKPRQTPRRGNGEDFGARDW
jgi:hypothetical protein